MSGAGDRTGTVHVVGAGLAGMAAALSLSRAGRQVILHEAAPQAGGRCRSFHDPQLGRRIDNGNHLLLSANRAALDYLEEIGAADTLVAGEAAFPFLDLATGERWTIAFGDGLARRLFAPILQVPGAGLRDLVGLLRLGIAGTDTTVLQALGAGPAMERFWRPLTAAVLNTEPEVASARLLLSALRRAVLDDGGGVTPLTARDGLTESFVDPALTTLQRRGVQVRFGHRLRAIEQVGTRATALRFQNEAVALSATDAVVLAVPPMAATALLPEVPAPVASSAILNAHFQLPEPAILPVGGRLIGLVGGMAQWVFLRGDLASVTVSAADALIDRGSDVLLDKLWRDTAMALGSPREPMPPGRIVKERRATFRQTPDAARSRPGPQTHLANLALAGDWTATGLPATIDGAIHSGRAAAAVISATVIAAGAGQASG